MASAISASTVLGSIRTRDFLVGSRSFGVMRGHLDSKPGRLPAVSVQIWRRRSSSSRAMRPEEGTYLAHRQGNPLLGLLPWEHAHFGLRREHRGFHGDSVRMRRDIIRQDQYGRPAIAHEITCHTPDEIWV